MSKDASAPWPTWVRCLVFAVGLAVSATAGVLTYAAAMIVAIMAGAAPLLAEESTPQQPWVTPVSLGAGLVIFGFGVRFSVAVFRSHRAPDAAS